MTERAENLLREALALPSGDRADLAAELLASLDQLSSDDPEAVRELWRQEIERRARRVLAGDSSGQDWTQVRDRLHTELTQG